ncbi:protein AAR2 homolog [Aplysia californica]|uniref:Protein AAR2 homolog n=1 Tax=Aplysia californica TaxID=6500 RepID=A0ABM0K5E7_APLCA|nr:protein AAR2 homolog [Aplysia californica]
MTSERGNQTPHMDAEKAQVLFEHGAMFLLLNFPEGSEFGIDNYSWTVGPNFRGIKMIPPGIHFIFYSSVNSDHQAGPRSGFFYNFASKEIVVKKWSVQMEEIQMDEVSEAEMEKFHDNKQEMDKYLGPYPYERYKQWVSLSNHITDTTLRVLQPDCGFIYSVAQFESEGSTSQSRQASAVEKSKEASTESSSSSPQKPELPHLKQVIGTNIKYSVVPKQRYPPGSSPSEITKYSMDSSYVLSLLLTERYNKDIDSILGEVQFAFLCFLLGQNYESFEQWKKLVHLLCTSEEAIMKNPKVYQDFISLLHFQVREIPSDFFVDIVTSNNFLTVTLHELFQNLEGDGVDSKLQKKGHSFRKHLTEKFNWDFTSEPDDFAPVVVDT